MKYSVKKSWLMLVIIAPLIMVCFTASAATLLKPSHAGGSAWKLDRCAACHPLRFIHLKEPSIYTLVGRGGYATCYSCHGSNGSQKKKQKTCISCHKPRTLRNTKKSDKGYPHKFSKPKSRLTNKSCNRCHANDIHGSDGTGNRRPRCATCHNKTYLPALPAIDGDFPHDFSNQEFSTSDDGCINCHDIYTHLSKGDEAIEARCRTCHNVDFLPGLPASGGIASHNFDSSTSDLNDKECKVCHDDGIHNFSDADNKQTRCVACHNSQFLPDYPASEGIYPHDFSIEESSLNDEACISCHDEQVHGSTDSKKTAERCITCHNTRFLPNNPASDGAYPHNFSNAKSSLSNKGCIGCHESYTHDANSAEERVTRCIVCHNTTMLSGFPTAASRFPHNFNATGFGLNDRDCINCHDKYKHGADEFENGQARCSTCHQSNTLSNIPSLNGAYPHNFKGRGASLSDDSCINCHEAFPHGSSNSNTLARCGSCHSFDYLPELPPLDGTTAHNFGFGGSGFNDKACAVCHEASDMDGEFDPVTDLTKLPDAMGNVTASHSITAFCLRCHNQNHQVPGFEIEGDPQHDPVIAMENNYRFIDYHGLRKGRGNGIYSGLRKGYRYATWVECSDCHAVHGTNNPSLLIDRSAKGASRLLTEFSDKDLPVKISNGNFAQLCVLCHQMRFQLDASEDDTGNGLAGVHQVVGDCRICHTHGKASQAGL